MYIVFIDVWCLKGRVDVPEKKHIAPDVKTFAWNTSSKAELQRENVLKRDIEEASHLFQQVAVHSLSLFNTLLRL